MQGHNELTTKVSADWAINIVAYAHAFFFYCTNIHSRVGGVAVTFSTLVVHTEVEGVAITFLVQVLLCCAHLNQNWWAPCSSCSTSKIRIIVHFFPF